MNKNYIKKISVGKNKYIKEYNITPEQIDRAKNYYQFDTMFNNIGDIDRNKLVGALGEIVVADAWSGTRADSYEYDVIIKGKHVDVKTTTRDYPPAGHYNVKILRNSMAQKCDYYAFVVISKNFKKAWICGFISRADFKQHSEFVSAGTKQNNSNYVYKKDSFVMRVIDVAWPENKKKKGRPKKEYRRKYSTVLCPDYIKQIKIDAIERGETPADVLNNIIKKHYNT